jgi:L-asparagine transporter-like permease
MDLLTLIIVLVIVGVVMWAINTYIPMEQNIKQLLNIAVVIFIVVWLLINVFHIQFPNLRI